MANNDQMVNMMNGDDDPSLKNNIFLRWLSKKMNPATATAPDTSDLDNPMVGAGDDGGNAGYGTGSHEHGNEGTEDNTKVTSATTVPSMFAFAAKPAAGSSPDLANDQPKAASQPVNLEKAGHLPRSRQQEPPQYHNGAIVGLVNNPDARTQAEVGEDAESLPQNNFGVPYGGEGELGVLSGVGEKSNPDQVAAGAEDEAANDLPTLAPQGSGNRFLRTVQKLFGFVGDNPQPGQKYDPASAPSHKIAENLLQRLGNAGAAIGYPQTDPRELMLKKQEISLELARLNEELEYHKELYGDRDARTQILAQRLADMQQYHNGLIDKLSQKTVEKFNPDTNQVELYGWDDKSQDYTRPMGLAGHQPKTSAQAAPSRPFVMGTKLYRYPTAEEQANGQNDPVLLGDAPAKSAGRGSAAGSLDQLKPIKGPNGNVIEVYDPTTKQKWYPQDIKDPNMPFYVQKFWQNVAANQKEPTKSKGKGKIVF